MYISRNFTFKCGKPQAIDTDLILEPLNLSIHCFLFPCMDCGRPVKPFFIEIQIFWAWPDKFGR